MSNERLEVPKPDLGEEVRYPPAEADGDVPCRDGGAAAWRQGVDEEMLR